MATRTYTKEKDVKAEVKKLLERHQWFWWMPPANGFGQTGISDFNALRGGVFLAIETKFGGRKPSPMQKGYMGSVIAESGFAFVVDETTLPWLDMWLGAFDRAAEAASRNERPSSEDGATMLNAIKAMTELLQ